MTTIFSGTVSALSRIIVAGVLFYAGGTKLRRLHQFRANLQASRLFRTPAITIIVLGVPVLEVVIPLWILSSDSALPLIVSVLLLLIFTAYLLLLTHLNVNVPCGCLGGKSRISDPFMRRNGGLMALALAGVDGPYAVWFALLGTTLLITFAADLRRAARARPALAGGPSPK